MGKPSIAKQTHTGIPKFEDEQPLERLEEGLVIEEHGLEDECRAQAKVFYRVSKQVTYAISQRDAAKQMVAEVEAEADERIRHRASVDDERITDTAVKARVTLDPAVKAARQQLLDYTLKAAQLTALKEAFQQRSYALNHLVDLYISNYFSDSSTSRSANNARELNAGLARTALNRMRRKSEAAIRNT